MEDSKNIERDSKLLEQTVLLTGETGRIAEWDMLIPLETRQTFSMVHLCSLLNTFNESFPWTRIRYLETTAIDNTGHFERYQASGEAELRNFLAQSWRPSHSCGGVELILDMKLDWQDVDGRMHCDWIGPAGQFNLEMVGRAQKKELLCTLTIHLNLFTDVIWLHPPALDDGTNPPPVLHRIDRAAPRNRQRVADSLAQWLERAQGTIDNADTQLAAGSVDAGGFTDRARLRWLDEEWGTVFTFLLSRKVRK